MKSIYRFLFWGVVMLNIFVAQAGMGPIPELDWQILNPQSDIICCGEFVPIHVVPNKIIIPQKYTQLQLNIDLIIKGSVATNSVYVTMPNTMMGKEYTEGHNRYLLFLKLGQRSNDFMVVSDWILKLGLPNNKVSKGDIASSEKLEHEVLTVIEQSKTDDENTRLAWSLIRSIQPHSAFITAAMVRLSTNSLTSYSVDALSFRLFCDDFSALNLIDKYIQNDKGQLLDSLYGDLMKINKSSAIPYLTKCFGIKRPYLERGAMEALSNCVFDKRNKDIKEMILCGLRSEDEDAQYYAIKSIRQGWKQELRDQIKDKTMSKLPSYSRFHQNRAEYIQAWREVMLNN